MSKHNEANGEGNRDGTDNNLSWNCGSEGQTGDFETERLRNRQVKNFLTVTLLAIGTPMLLMGDEVRRTQAGNNNAYCQDNETSWFDWTLVEQHADIHRFAKQMIALRMNRSLPTDYLNQTLSELLLEQRVEWHGVILNSPDWGDQSHTLAGTVHLLGGRLKLHLILNAYWEALEFQLPRLDRQEDLWHRCVDTYLEAPDDICEWRDAPPVLGWTYHAQPRSVVLLLGKA
jgi:isoamylase